MNRLESNDARWIGSTVDPLDCTRGSWEAESPHTHAKPEISPIKFYTSFALEKESSTIEKYSTWFNKVLIPSTTSPLQSFFCGQIYPEQDSNNHFNEVYILLQCSTLLWKGNRKLRNNLLLTDEGGLGN